MKQFFVMVVILMVGMTVSAQDTVVSKVPPSNCYYAEWIDTNHGASMINGSGSLNIPLCGKFFNTKDSIDVYGIAVGIWDRGLTANTCVWLTLHKAGAGTLVPMCDTLSLYPACNDPAYWYDVDMLLPIYNDPLPLIPVYEAYFDEPVRVADSFYVCVIDSLSEVGAFPPDEGWYYGLVYYRSEYGYESEDRVLKIRRPFDTIYAYNHEPGGGLVYLFPIIDSVRNHSGTEVDTTIGGGDTLGISRPQLQERCVLVTPNPAQSWVKVTSILGMSSIELYSMTGMKLADWTADGYSFVMDISMFSAGNYFIKVHTPMGVVSKKLLVQRK